MKQQLFLDVGKEKILDKSILEQKKTTDYKTTHYLVTKENKKEIKRSKGDYFILEYSFEKLLIKEKSIAKELEKILRSFFKKYVKNSKVLIIGLGNDNIIADSLGPKVTNNLIATNQYHDFLTIPKVALFNPSVTEKTGINSFKLIEMVVNTLKPDIILIIDSLATKYKEYLNYTIEINDTGIIPGSALNDSKEISQKTFNIPVISIGIPLCLNINNELYTTTNINDVLRRSSKLISNVLNKILVF